MTTRFTKQHAALQFHVADNGKGIPKEVISNIFERTIRFEPGHEEEGQGSGLSLWIAYKLVKLHEGCNLEVISAGKDRGSEFVLTIPLSSIKEVAGRRPISNINSSLRSSFNDVQQISSNVSPHDAPGQRVGVNTLHYGGESRGGVTRTSHNLSPIFDNMSPSPNLPRSMQPPNSGRTAFLPKSFSSRLAGAKSPLTCRSMASKLDDMLDVKSIPRMVLKPQSSFRDIGVVAPEKITLTNRLSPDEKSEEEKQITLSEIAIKKRYFALVVDDAPM
eukprot:CAMPEP_0182423860 /NCGR_PEP_ID=MMETSP1167-20130531/9936_1 /TAXON_ID=2988 /ORGANISM="Mallomonas Sp, Strain CCMP3275" /LENGTH=274 /DNA_ID=CAMNT_0024603171 /DNA_START=189 /DNA_END=1010 /DNA_ORIENTATION=-